MMKIEPSQNEQADLKRRLHEADVNLGNVSDIPLPGEAGPAQWQDTFAPQRRFIMKDWIIRGAAGLLGGEDGVGKSLLAQQMATCAAAGIPFLGADIERCRTIFINCEDPGEEMHRRQESINAALGVDMVDIVGWFKSHSLKGELGNELGIFDAQGRFSPTERFQQIRRTALEFGAELIFIDNAAHVFPGNENARHDVAVFLSLLERLSLEIDGAVILLAHPNKQHSQGNKKGNEYSGTTGWSAHVRNRIFLDWNAPEGGLPADPDERVLRRSKSNYAARGAEIKFRWHQWAFVRADDLPPNINDEIAKISRANAENDLFLKCLDKTIAERRAVSVSKQASNYAPRTFAQMPMAKGFTVKAFEAAMRRLLNLSEIVNDQPIYKRENRSWVRGLGRAPNSAPTMHQPCAQTRTEEDCKANETLHTGARTGWSIDKSISGAAHEVAAPIDDDDGGTE